MRITRKTTRKRVFALLIDLLLFAAVGAIVFAIFWAIGINLLILIPVLSVMLLIYPLAFELSHMAGTPGMYVLGLHVSVESDRVMASIYKRFLWRILTCLPLGFGFWYAFLFGNGKTLYDVLSNTYVTEAAVIKIDKRKPCVFRQRSDGSSKCYILRNNKVIFGRNPDMCQVLFSANNSTISRCHCALRYNEQTNMFLLEDLNSSNGTFLLPSGTPVKPGNLVSLSEHDSFCVGIAEYKFTVGFTENEND